MDMPHSRSPPTFAQSVPDWPGWRALSMELPNDWEEGYLRAINGVVEFVYGKPPPDPARKA